MNNKDQIFIAEKIYSEYTHIDKKHTPLTALMEVDSKAKMPAKVFAFIFGSIGTLVMGSGMSLIMSDIGETLGIANTMFPGLILGIGGMLIVFVNYPVYSVILKSRKKKYAPQVVELSRKITKE